MSVISEQMTLSRTPQTAGGMLAAARRGQNLDVTEISIRLRLSPWQVEALENDQYERLAGPTFVRGIIRSYAKLLQIDPHPALDAYGHDVSDADLAPINVPSQNIRFKPEQASGWNMLVKVGVVFFSLVVLGMGLWIWYGAVGVGIQKSIPQLVAKLPQEAQQLTRPLSPPVIAPTQSAPVAAPVTTTGVAPVPPEPVSVKRADNPAPDPTASPASAPSGKGVQTEQLTRPLSPPVIAPTRPAPVAAPVTRTTIAPIPPEPVSAKLANSPAPVGAVATGIIPPGKGVLHFIFTEESWVEVTNGKGKIIFKQLNPSGSEQIVTGTPPFGLVVGNGQGVRLFYNEKPIDLTPYIRVHVARLTLNSQP